MKKAPHPFAEPGAATRGRNAPAWLQVFAFWQKQKERGEGGDVEPPDAKESQCDVLLLPQVHGHKAQFPSSALVCPFLTKINVPVREAGRVITRGGGAPFRWERNRKRNLDGRSCQANAGGR